MFDVSEGKSVSTWQISWFKSYISKIFLDFYGKNGAYGVFAGKDVTRAIAKWSKDANEIDRGNDIVSKNLLI